MTRLLVLLLLPACAASRLSTAETKSPAAAPRCVTVCGLHGDLDPATCDALNVAEARILKHYAEEVPDFRPGYLACMTLAGWTVRVVERDDTRDRKCPEDSWGGDKTFKCLCGLTTFDKKTIDVMGSSFTFNAFAHEVGHVLEHALSHPQGATHCGWGKSGIKTAIFKSTGERDTTEEVCD